jgi:anthranilate synthase component II
MFLLIDNYDSFTYNLWHYLRELGAEVIVKRNDAIAVAEVLAMGLEGVVISPGPSIPEKAGICVELARQAGRLPILGVCLGHQAIGVAFGGRVIRAPEPVHGKVGRIFHDRSGVFAGLPSPFSATRYHSLIVERASLPPSLRVTASSEDGLVMGLEHTERPIHGVQFHPESIETQHGHALLRNFLALASGKSLAA